MLEVCLLGRFEVRRDGDILVIPSRASQSLFAYLLLNPGIQHRREQLGGLLTPDSTDENARSTLRHALWRLRKALGSDPHTGRDYFVVDELTVGFDPQAGCTLDVNRLVGPATAATPADELIAAVTAYGGELLPGFYDDWVTIERERLAAAFENKMRLLLDRLIADARWTDVLAWGEQWIARGGTPEAAYRALMVAHAALGDGARAAAAYRRCEEALREQLGVEPGQATRELFARLRKGQAIPGLPQSAALLLPATAAEPEAEIVPREFPPAPGDPPFKGLQYFDTADAGLFFGREALVDQLLGRLAQRNLLIVVGASGSGKSSLMRAGLIPTLQRGGAAARPGAHGRPGSAVWQYHVITPTSHPLQSLALALTSDSESVTAAATLADDLGRDPRSLALYATRLTAGASGRQPGHIFLAIDQFEELFTLCRSEEERAAFIANLLTAVPPDGGPDASPLTLVLTLRADFYARCAQYPELRAALTLSQEYIGAMSPDELRRAIECPAAAGGWEFEPGLVDELLHDTGAEPGALPLLSHALLETWQRRRGRTMTLGGYTASGRVAGAIAHTAQTTYTRLPPEQQAAVRNIFLRLTELGQGTQDTRRRARLSELLADEASRPLVASVLDVLADARLITVAENQAEVAHEALIREWPLLREWLAADREGLLLHRQLTEAADSWEELEHDPGELYRGGRLARALEWTQAHPGDLNPLERSFLDASREAAESEEREREAQQERELAAAQKLAAAEGARADEQRTSARRLRSRARLLAAALALALLLGGAAIFLATKAQQSAQSAQQNAQQALQNEQRAESAAQVAGQERTRATIRELSSAAVANKDSNPQLGLLLAIKAAEKAQAAGLPIPVDVEDALHQALQAARLRATIEGTAAVAVSPDAALAATAAANGEISVWPLAAWSAAGTVAGSPQTTFTTGGSAPDRLAFSADHRLLAAATGSMLAVWDVATGALTAEVKGLAPGVSTLLISTERPKLAALDGDGVARVLDPETGREILRTGSREDPVFLLDLSPNGGRLAVRYWRGGIEIWDANRGQVKTKLDRWVVPGAWAMDFCGPGRLLVQSLDTTTMWDSETGQRVRDIQGLAGMPPVTLACTADGGRVAVGGRSLPLRMWELDTGRELDRVPGEAGATSVAFSPDGALIVTGQEDFGTAPRLQVWEALSGAEWAAFATGVPARWAALTSDGGVVAAGTRRDSSFRVWPVPPVVATAGTGGVLAPRTPLAQLNAFVGIDVLPIALSPDGRVLAAGTSVHPEVRSITYTGRAAEVQGPQLLPASADYGGATALAFSPDGQRLAGLSVPSGRDQPLQVWDLVGSTGNKVPVAHALPDLRLAARPLALAWSPAGDTLAVGLADGQVTIVDVSSGARRATWAAHRGNVLSATFSPDGARLATTGGDGLGMVWSLGSSSGGAVAAAELRAHAAPVRGAAFLQGGSRVATASDDGTIRVWDAQTGRELYVLAKGSGAVLTLNADRDGTRLVAGGEDGVRVYLLPVDEVLALAQIRAARDLTPSEAVQFLHETAQAAAPVTSTPRPALAASHEEVLRAFVRAWAYGDVDGAVSLFDFDGSLTIPASEQTVLPYQSIAGFRTYFVLNGQGVGGRFDLQSCKPRPDDAGALDCILMYRDGCSDALGDEPVPMAFTFGFSSGRIASISGGAPSEIAKRILVRDSLINNWATRHAFGVLTHLVGEAVSTESEALTSGRTWLSVCRAYAASLGKAPTAAP